jgi:Rod binding domain-containing protein
MSTISGLSSANASFASVATVLPATSATTLGRGQKAAREFEAQLIGTVLESMEKTFAALPGQDEVPGQDDYNYLGTQALSSALAAGGGFGIARMIAQHLQGTKVANEGSDPEEPGSVSGH